MKTRRKRVVSKKKLSEFETFEKAVAAYESEDYQKALKALDNGADREIRIFAGV